MQRGASVGRWKPLPQGDMTLFFSYPLLTLKQPFFEGGYF
jgi:hypothetical protein